MDRDPSVGRPATRLLTEAHFSSMSTERRRYQVSPRQSRRVETFLDGAIEAMRRQPIDRITVHDICAISGSTRTTFYSYFGNLDGIYADLWIARGRPLIEGILHGNPLTNDELDLFRASVAIMSISNRSNEILEAITEGGAQGSDAPFDRTRIDASETARVWLLASLIGWELSRYVMPEERTPSRLMAFLGSIEPTSEAAATTTLRPLDLHEPEFDVSSSRGRIMSSAYSVFANAGIANSSMVRVARRAGLSAASCYSEFTNLTQLALQTYVTANQLVIEQNSRASLPDFNPAQQLVALLLGGLSPSRKIWREFRKELFLFASFDPELRSVLMSQSHVSERMTTSYAQLFGVDVRSALEISTLIHCLGLGLGVLHNIGLVLDIEQSLSVAELLLSAQD